MEDLTGKEFGKWKVISRAYDNTKSRGAKWNCQCQCGTRRIVFGKNLRNGTSRSCGCDHKRSWVGEKFGHLTIQEVCEVDGDKIFKCVCDCGNTIDVHGTSIYGTESCGCSRLKHKPGERYGSLVIDRIIPNMDGNNVTYVSCTCDCGKTGFITRLNALVSGNTKTCGCAHSPNLIGKKFGRLTVIKEIESSSSQRRWLCECDCGKTIGINSHTLTSGHTKSCGCLRSDKNSLSEKFVRKYLSTIGAEYEAERTFDDCIGVNGWKLRFDFFLPDYSMTIECDGMQHYRPIEYFGGQDKFDVLSANDKVKNEYCERNDILLLRLPYTDTEEDIMSLISFYINIQESRNDHSLKGND